MVKETSTYKKFLKMMILSGVSEERISELESRSDEEVYEAYMNYDKPQREYERVKLFEMRKQLGKKEWKKREEVMIDLLKNTLRMI